jgi:hypothetical protein
MGRKSAVKKSEWRTPTGLMISEADAARLAQQFESDDIELDSAHLTFPRKSGRPSLTGATGTSPQVSFRLSPDARRQAEKIAADRGTTVSALAREALEELVNRSA